MSEEDTIDELKRLSETAIVCQHLLESRNIGFNVPGNIDTDMEAWCDSCEILLQKAGEWTDELVALADLKACCGYCFSEMRNYHREKQRNDELALAQTTSGGINEHLSH